MKLVEVVVADETSDETRGRALAFVRQINKLPVVRDRPGFLVNRVLFPYLLDAVELFESGIGTQEIDQALVDWGMPMGPLRLIDEIGVDIAVDIAETLEKAFGRRDHAPAVLQWLLESKMLGRKTGSGFYKYEGKSQTPNDALRSWHRAGVVAGVVEPGPGGGDAAGEPGSTTPATAGDDIANRVVLLMVDEAARCLEEGVVESPEDADYGMIIGTGFAPHRGGPLRFADYFGAKKVVDEMERLAQQNEKFSPSEILKKHAREGTRFYEW